MFSTREQVQELEKKVDTLQNDIAQLHTKIDKLELLLQKEVVPSCSKMGSHIDFVECVYDKVQSPLGYLVGKVNYMIGGSSKTETPNALPDIERTQNVENSNVNQ